MIELCGLQQITRRKMDKRRVLQRRHHEVNRNFVRGVSNFGCLK
jgi:hypothetical protein